MSDNGGYDVAIVGGGPAGSTTATILLKYNPALRVIILEKARFPREHVGESLLPVVTHVLNEMGAWDKVEAANFPVKLGASFMWGKDKETWDFDLYPAAAFQDEPRPAKFVGQRQFTAFQVERAIYDDILLRHAEEMGAEVRRETGVDEVLRDGDRIEGFRLSTGDTIRATHYVDGSGNVGLIRRAMGVETEQPTELRNIAFWDYWDNVEWAVKIGVGGTRIQVRSLAYGWLWFIPLGPTRASVGLVCPVEHYKSLGLSPEQMYEKAVREDELVSRLTRAATREGEVRSTKDWSFLSKRLIGENWFLCGEAAGFADPILSAGLSLTHESAREVAYTILELERGTQDGDWLRTQYDERTRRSIWQHIRFALYWYSANARFTDLQGHCQRIAADAGLELSQTGAWHWLARGGFANYSRTGPAFGSYDLASAKALVELFQGGRCDFSFDRFNVFTLNLEGATPTMRSEYKEGRVERVPCIERDGKLLPLSGAYLTVKQTLERIREIVPMFEMWKQMAAQRLAPAARPQMLTLLLQTLDAMVIDGWVEAAREPGRPMLSREHENPFKKSMKQDRTIPADAPNAGTPGPNGAGSPTRPAARSGASGRTPERRFKKRK